MFGLTNGEGNHGEDAKEYWFYLDSTPTHSYMKCRYKYPQRAFPYDDLLATNRARGRQDFEYELLDTGIFDEDRYFDVVVEYAKAAPDDILLLVTAHNRGPQPATLHLLPTLWFRNTWAWGDGAERPSLTAAGPATVRAEHPELGTWRLLVQDGTGLLFCDNETNTERLFGVPCTSHVSEGRDQRPRGRGRAAGRDPGHEVRGPSRARDRARSERDGPCPADHRRALHGHAAGA